MKPLRWLALGAVLLSSSVSLGEQKTPIAAARFSISIDGYQASVMAFEGGGAASEKAKASSIPLKITVDRTGSEPIWQWIAASINQGPVEKTVTGKAKGRRRATFAGAVITEVKLDDLDANSNKKPMRVQLTVVPKQIVAAADVLKSAPEPSEKGWSPSSFRIRLGNLSLSKVKKVESISIKQTAAKDGKSPVLALDDVRITLDEAEAKIFANALAKDKTKPLTIALTNDDGSVWKTLTVSGLTIKTSTASGGSGTITIKGSKILMN